MNIPDVMMTRSFDVEQRGREMNISFTPDDRCQECGGELVPILELEDGRTAYDCVPCSKKMIERSEADFASGRYCSLKDIQEARKLGVRPLMACEKPGWGSKEQQS